MNITTQRARITVDLRYTSGNGRQRHIPIGPCLIERQVDGGIEIIWGANGQHAATLSIDQFVTACDLGTLVILD